MTNPVDAHSGCTGGAKTNRYHQADARQTSSTSSWIFAFTLLITVLLASNYQLLTQKVAPQWDAVDFFGPAFSLVSDHARAQHFLLWDPWVSGGTPDWAEPELGTTSPILLALAAASSHIRAGFVAYWMLIWIGSGVGMLFLARYLNCPAWGALAASLGFVTSGFFINHAQHISSLYSVAFLPWICWRLDDALLSRRWWSAVQAGALYGLSALGGYPQFTILTPGFLGLWVLGRMFLSDLSIPAIVSTSRQSFARFIAPALKLCLVGVVGSLIFAAPYYGLVSETRGYSDRIGERSRVESLNSNILPAEALTTFASPYLSLLTYPGVPGRLWSRYDVSMSNIYSGAVTTVLALLALLTRSRWRWWLGLLAAVFLGASLGEQMPLRGWLYDFVPPTRYFRNASMFSCYSIFLVSVLCALCARDWRELSHIGKKQHSKFMVATMVVGASALLAFFVVVRKVPNPPFQFQLAIIQLATTWIGLALAGFLWYLQRMGNRRFLQFLILLAVTDAVLTITISKPVLYSEATTAWWHAMDREHVTDLSLISHGLYRQLHVPPEFEHIEYRNNRNIPPKVQVLESYSDNVFRNHFDMVLQKNPALLQFALGSNRTWFTANVVITPPNNEAFAQFAAAMRETEQPLVFVHTPEDMNAFSKMKVLRGKSLESAPSGVSEATDWRQPSPATPAPIQLLEYRPNSLEFEFTSPEPGWLMVTDRWAPGWKAQINHKPVAVYGADFLFRAIPVEPGTSLIRFSYEPRAWQILVLVSWTTLAIVLIISVVLLIRPERSPRVSGRFVANVVSTLRGQ